MARWQGLNEAQIAELFDPPVDQRELVRQFTLSAEDILAIQRCRGDHNRLGYALMLCYLRYPGRAMRAGEYPPTALLDFVAGQIGVFAQSIDEYLATDRNRERYALECQEYLGLRSFSKRAREELITSLLPQAIENDRLFHLAKLVMETCRQRDLIVPPPAVLERFCNELRRCARREVHHRLTNGLSFEQRQGLDALIQRREESNLSWLAWTQQMPTVAKPASMLSLIERLKHVRAIGISPDAGHLIHQACLAQLVREAGRTTVQHIAGFERHRRHATLVAISLDLTAKLTDQAIDLFERLIGGMFSKAENRHAKAFKADAKAINEKVNLYARIGAALIRANETRQDSFEAISSVIPWNRFCSTVAEAEALARPEEFDAFKGLSEHYSGIRRWSPTFLEASSFKAYRLPVRSCVPLKSCAKPTAQAGQSCQNQCRPGS